MEQEELFKQFTSKTAQLFKQHLATLIDLKARLVSNEILLKAALLRTQNLEAICDEAEQTIDSMPPEEDEFLGGKQVHLLARKKLSEAIAIMRKR